MKNLSLVTLTLTFIFLTSISRAGTYYVDNIYGKDYNTGTSSSSPWKTISKVNSRTFKPGDKILFKRGSSWRETLYIKQNGSSSYPITYSYYGSGNAPVIDGSGSRSSGIYMDGRYYIVIGGFKIQNTTHGAVRVIRSKYITVKDNEFYITGRAGVFVEESSYCTVQNNKMTTPSTYYNVQTDGIYAQKNSYNTYSGNNISIRNEHAYQHCDAIQTYLETSPVIKNNYVEQKNTKSGEAQGIYCSETYGTAKIFNNIAYGMYTQSSLIKFKNSGTSGKVQMIGNTVYGGQAGLVQTNDPYIIFKNNIVVTTGGNAVVNFERSLSSKSNINYNLYKRSSTGGNLVVYKGYAYTLSRWKSSGYDTYAIEKDPRFKSISSKDFGLLSDSPALNRGVNLSSPFNVDKVGTARPYSSRSDMGAFEMKILAKEDTGTPNQEAEVTTPGTFELDQNYPNPFNPTTNIKFSIPENSQVTLKVYDITGSEVAVLLDEMQNAGTHEITFDASNLASGTYIYMIKANDFVQTKKMMLLK